MTASPQKAWEMLNLIKSKMFPPDTLPPQSEIQTDTQGWMSRNYLNFFDEALRRSATVEQPLIIEVGTWKGHSAIAMAFELYKRNLNGRIVCVDTFLGSPEHYVEEEYRSLYDLVDGIPDLRQRFVKNVRYTGALPYIWPFVISSAQAASYFIQNNVLADIIYIDAGHEYESVKLDIELYWSVLKPGGSMILDDYKWEGVKKAVDEFGASSGVKVELSVDEDIVLITKPSPTTQ